MTVKFRNFWPEFLPVATHIAHPDIRPHSALILNVFFNDLSGLFIPAHSRARAPHPNAPINIRRCIVGRFARPEATFGDI